MIDENSKYPVFVKTFNVGKLTDILRNLFNMIDLLEIKFIKNIMPCFVPGCGCFENLMVVK